MGGPRSGNRRYRSKKTVVEDCLQIDVNELSSAGVLVPGRSGGIEWFQRCSRRVTDAVRYAVHLTTKGDMYLILRYSFRGTENIDLQVRLQTTPPQFGGRRWWFTCPLAIGERACDRRIGKLYSPYYARYFGCRHCHDLTYISCQESHKYDRFHSLHAAALGLDIGTFRRRYCRRL